MNYDGALAYLESLGTFGIQLGLARIERLLAKLNHPERNFRSVHVTGTNGKGSTSSFIASILGEAGIRTGLYTSPHLVDYPERMRINGRDITRESFAAVIAETRNAAEKMKEEGGESPTEFEVLTAAAFLWFSQEQAEYVVVEVGLGGLLDSTNVIMPEISVITNVTLEHTDKCGDTVEAIAAHKAGIIKTGRPVVTGAAGAALTIIEETARANTSPCYVLNRDFHVSDTVYHDGCQKFILHTPAGKMDCEIGLLGRHQVENAALGAVACLNMSADEKRLTQAAVIRGLKKAAWPGRFEIVGGEPLTILDGAHNPDGIRTLRQTLDEVYPGRPVVFLFGVLADKDHAEMVQTLFHPTDRAVVVEPNSPRAAAAEDIAAEIASHAASSEAAPTIAAGLDRARQLAGREGLVCAAGSLYMIGEARRLVVV